MHNAITDIPGLLVGHAQDEAALTGCTVVLCAAGAVGGMDQRGGAPGTRETNALRPVHLVREVHAVVLSGGSAFGLDAAGGTMRYLEERGVGFPVGPHRVPIVPAAILFDLGIGRGDIRPDAAMGYAACEAASDGPVAEGCVGAGMGATVGKLRGIEFAIKSGVGTAAIDLGGGLVVGALVAVNAVGEVFDPETGATIAGPRGGEPGTFAGSLDLLRERLGETGEGPTGNTVIGVVATNATLDKEGAAKVAQMAHNGLARTIRPAHTMMDGDTIFSLATGDHPAGSTPIEVSALGAFAAEIVAEAVLRAVRMAKSAGGIPAIHDWAK
ncbi:MAG TPA: P1 family peptidase [Anaerolineales bacterium]|nr:P1 family peptidase [Anaerolineales bacterium]